MKLITLLSLLFAATVTGRADFLLANAGRTRHVIVVDPAATPAEHLAAKELAATLRQITGAEFAVQTNTRAPTPRRPCAVTLT